ncbi:hypothetical protein AHAS_Ahas12G0125300 [Arachis hypogaea]
MTWYLQWAHTELFSLGDQHLGTAGVVPKDLPIHHPLAPDLHEPNDGHLLKMRPAVEGGRDYAQLRDQMSTPVLGPDPPLGRGQRDVRPPACGGR